MFERKKKIKKNERKYSKNDESSTLTGQKQQLKFKLYNQR